MVSATADSNVWVAAFNFAGTPRRMIEMAAAGKIGVAVSEPIIEEVVRTLREKFQWDDDALAEARYQLNGVARKVTAIEAVDIIKDDPADNRILECAAAARSELHRVGRQASLARQKLPRHADCEGGEFLDLVAKGMMGR